jgi:hypothetical protein
MATIAAMTKGSGLRRRVWTIASTVFAGCLP